MGMDRLAGLIFIAMGTGFLWLSLDFGFGSMVRIGPGFFPVILSCLLIALGAAILARGLLADESVVLPRVGPMARVLGAMMIFAGLMQPLGSYIVLPVVVVLLASASQKFRWKAAVLLAAAITICSDLIFRVALGLPLPVIGSWAGG